MDRKTIEDLERDVRDKLGSEPGRALLGQAGDRHQK